MPEASSSHSPADAVVPGRPPHALSLFDFARSARFVEGRIPLSAFARLKGDLAAVEGEPVAWSLRGWQRERRGAAAQPMVTLGLRAELPLVCQRCLQPVVVAVAETADFRLVREEPELTQDELDAQDDALPAEHPIDVLELIEDQLLLALPIVPVHDRCPQPLPGSRPGGEVADAEPESRQTPFANLRDLLKRGGPD